MSQNKKPLLIGITGNIGSGKSAFCNFLAANGLKVISADAVANQHLEDPAIKEALIKRYSTAILSPSNEDNGKGIINRKILADIVFGSEEETQYLNSLIHPLVLQDFQRIVEQSNEEALCFEVPLLFEANLQDCFDYIVLISASLETRLMRLEKRGEDRTKAQQRMLHQMTDTEKRFLVNLVIENDGDLLSLQKSAVSFIEKIPYLPHKKVRPFV
ncbi:MAG TPA: dephospho-CoA kinase [Candidatus Cloacimonas acidaminovorans]|jgi:dephospho-CoA kinase|nr:dephospho-CoA kinase [Candidatus Cloacimonas sp.]HPI42102.1 dephospho-CoA kinase [Candidatus Cloacimonas acidaminovorans]HQC07962.1 dephospho-CoA kinase [Candidatus Cloacimonas acidaminovorans]